MTMKDVNESIGIWETSANSILLNPRRQPDINSGDLLNRGSTSINYRQNVFTTCAFHKKVICSAGSLDLFKLDLKSESSLRELCEP